MRARRARLMLMSALLGASVTVHAQPASPPAAAPQAPLQEIVIEGRHEGPRMWTVREGEHTLWILGTISPLPKKLVWQPDAVRAVLRQT
jgi:hypothetical protein